MAAAVVTNALGRTAVTLTVTGTANVDPDALQNGRAASLADGRFRLSIADGAVTEAVPTR